MRLTSRHRRRWPPRSGAEPAGPASTLTRASQPDTSSRLAPGPLASPPMTDARQSPSPTTCHRRWQRWLLAIQMAVLAAVLMTLLTAAAPAHAETTHIVALAGTLTDVLNNIRNWLMGILATIAIVFFTWGGVRYLAAGGDPGEVEKAKGAFRNAGIGFALAALAPLIVAVLQGIVGGT